jgi:anti-sigma factor RsiW
VTPCAAWLPLLTDRAAGALDPAAATRLAAHLTGCAACRAEGEALDTVLAMAALPPPSETERAALNGLAESVRLEQRRAEQQRRSPVRYLAGLLAVAAAAAFLVAPAFTRRAPTLTAADVAIAETSNWVAPDANELWTASDLAADDGTTAAMAGADELALGVLLADD